MQTFAQNEPTAARRRVRFKLIDRGDNLTPEPGINLVTLLGDMDVEKSDGSTAAAAGVVTEVAGGWYRYEHAVAEASLIGDLELKIDTAAAAIEVVQSEVRSALQVYGHLYDSAVNIADYGAAAGSDVGVHGTLSNPTSSLANARILADALSPRRLRYLDNESDSLTAVSWDGYEFVAKGSRFGVLTVSAGTGFDGAGFMGLSALGVFPNGFDFVSFENSGILDATLPFGCTANNSGLGGTLVWTGGVGIFRDCFDSTVAVAGDPFIFDMNGLATPNGAIEFRRFGGRIQIDNMTAGGEIDLNLNGGTVTVDASCTNGSIKVSGEGRVINNSALVIDTSELLDSESLAILRAHKDAFVIDGGPGAVNVGLDAEGLMLAARIRVFRTKAAAAAATKGAADGADGEIAAIDQAAINTGVAGQFANMDLISQ